MQFNDFVIYVRNGKEIPAIVLKSAVGHPRPDVASTNHDQQAVPEEYAESLTLLYADPDNGETLVNAGATAKIPLIAFAVLPWKSGAAFGWRDWVIGGKDEELADAEVTIANLRAQVDELKAKLAAVPELTPEHQKAVDQADKVLHDTGDTEETTEAEVA